VELSGVRVVVIDDDAATREVLQMRLSQWGCQVSTAGSAEEGVALCESVDPAVVLCDVVLPDSAGIEILSRLRGEEPRSVVMITAHGSIDAAVDSVKRGALDFLTKPLDYAKLRAVLESAAEEAEQRASIRGVKERLAKAPGLGPLIGQSKAMKEVYKLMSQMATSDAPALITGESGTGKELAARGIHELSGRMGRPFIAANAAAIPEGLLESELFGHERGAFTGAVAPHAGCFEMADKGTLFLDEIAEMPAALQPKFLRTLEDGHVRRLGGREEKAFDVRVLAATNREPEEAVAAGLLRADLYYRLNVFTIFLPPLRDRSEDLPLLVQHFVDLFNAKHGASVEGIRPQVAAHLESYPWPGNVRELRNVMERAVILARSGWVETAHMPAYMREPHRQGRGLLLPPGLTLAQAEERLIRATLEEAGGNKAEAARRLGLDVKTIRNKLRAFSVGDGG